MSINPLSAKFIKWSNTLKQIVGKLPTICLSVFDHFMNLALKGLTLLTGKNYRSNSTQEFVKREYWLLLIIVDRKISVLSINPLTTSVPHHIETSQLIYDANQLTGFHMMWNIGR